MPDQFLTFEIHLQDALQVSQLQGNPPGETSTQPGTAQKCIIRAPFNPRPAPNGGGAAVEFAPDQAVHLQLLGPNDPTPLDAVTHQALPYMRSEWFTSTNNFPRDVSTFTRKSGGWFGIPLLFGTTTRFFWRGVFVYDPPPVTTAPDGSPGRENIQTRRWVDGFQILEDPAQNTFQGDSLALGQSRAAGRTPDSMGITLPGQGGSTARTHYLVGAPTPLSTFLTSWERLYIRLRAKPSATVVFWKATGHNGAGEWDNGMALGITPTGQIAVFDDNAGVYNLLGTISTPLTLGAVAKLDVLPTFGALSGSITVYVNNVQAITIAMPHATIKHQKSQLVPTSDALWLMDVCFWMNATQPANFTGIDWLNGSLAVLVRPTGFGAAHLNWTGDWRLLSAHPQVQSAVASQLQSTTASSYLAATTDSAQSVDARPGSLGAVAMAVALFSYRGTTSGTLGYKLGAAAPVMAAITQNVAGTYRGQWNWVLYTPAAAALPQPLGTVELHHVKGADATLSGVNNLVATVELIGTFGVEDYPQATPAALKFPIPYLGTHNAPYPATPWARTVSPPISPVVIKAGTYVGNGTGQDLAFRAPVNWLWIRHITAAPKNVRWWSSLLGGGAHRGSERSPFPSLIPSACMDPNFSTASTAGAPTGAGAVPDRSADIATVFAANTILTASGTTADREQLLQAIVRYLNLTYAGDGNNWGIIRDTSTAAQAIVPGDICWNNGSIPVSVLSPVSGPVTTPIWVVQPAGPAAWTWTAVSPEGQQEIQCLVRIAGADADVNQGGETYTYVAIMDPGMRFMLNESIAIHASGASIPFARALLDAGFTPIAGFFIDDTCGSTLSDTQIRATYKGPGNAAAAVTLIGGAVVTPAVTFGAGSITIDSGMLDATFNNGRLSCALFRRDDGSHDPGVTRVVQITSYVGNGAGGTRGIALTPPSGMRPLWAIVVPGDGQPAFVKDSADTGGVSHNASGTATSTTAIISGNVDEIDVGVTLNANGTVYNVFVIVGGLAGGADGFSNPGEFVPVEPGIPPGTQWGQPPEPPVDGGGGSGGGGSVGDTPGQPGGGADDMGTDLAFACIPFTTRAVNIAFSRIGVSKQVGNLAATPAWDAAVTYAIGAFVSRNGVGYVATAASTSQAPPNVTYWAVYALTDVSQEADLARLHYAKDLRATLHDFPWPFATREVNLTLLGGTPAAPIVGDWIYSYRQPTDCVFERRIVVPRSGAIDPTPPPFQLSYDDGGNRILTNEPSAMLEYTARPSCTAGVADPLFLDAFYWKLAGSFAGPLTRIDDVVKMCQDKYAEAIQKAITVLRPGNPGQRGPAYSDALDLNVDGTSNAVYEAANQAVVNRALIRIGARTVANLFTEQSREAESARNIFEDELQSTLRDHPWAFVTSYAALLLVTGSPDAPANADWTYAYRTPADSVLVRRIVRPNTGTSLLVDDDEFLATEQVRGPRGYDRQPIPFRIGQDATGELLFTSTADPTIEYTARLAGTVARADALFRDAFAWRLAASLAPSLAQADPEAIEQHGRGPQDRPRERKATEAQLRAKATDFAWQKYREQIEKARVADMREQQQDPNPGDADWIAGRN